MEKVFVEMINTHRGIIFKVCNLYGANQEDKNDLFQEIVLQLWKAFPKFKGESKFSTWLYRVAINTAITGLRKKKDFIVSIEPARLPVQRAYENGSIEEEQWQQMSLAIEQLNPVEKSIVLLYLEDKSYEEMEDILGIGQGTLRVKMTRIKEKLRQLAKTIDYGT